MSVSTKSIIYAQRQLVINELARRYPNEKYTTYYRGWLCCIGKEVAQERHGNEPFRSFYHDAACAESWSEALQVLIDSKRPTITLKITDEQKERWQTRKPPNIEFEKWLIALIERAL